MQREPTGFTREQKCITVGAFGMSASTTGLGRIRCIDGHHDGQGGRRLIADELFELIERPSVKSFSLPLSELALADTFEVFHRYNAVRGKVCDSSADEVIHLRHEAFLFAGQPLQNTPDTARIGLCLSGLERSAGFEIAVADIVGMPAAEEKLLGAVSDHGDIPYTTIHADKVRRNTGRGHGSLERAYDVRLALADVKASISERPRRQVFSKARFAMKRDTLYASVDSDNRQAVPGKREVPTTNTALKLYGAIIPEMYRALGYTLQLFECGILRGNGTDSIYRHLRRQAEHRTRIGIDHLVKPDRVSDTPVIKGNPAYPVTGIIPSLYRSGDNVKIRVDLDSGGTN